MDDNPFNINDEAAWLSLEIGKLNSERETPKLKKSKAPKVSKRVRITRPAGECSRTTKRKIINDL